MENYPDINSMQGAQAMSPAIGIGVLIVYLAVALLVIVGFWKIFTKAGKPGWASIVPIYSAIVFLEIVGRPLWWFVLLLIPFVNFIVMIILMLDLAKRFGKGGGFAAGLILLPVVFIPLLGFGSAQYQAPQVAAA